MLRWMFLLFVVSIIAAALGFGGIAGPFAPLAEVAFFLLLAALVATLVFHVTRRA